MSGTRVGGLEAPAPSPLGRLLGGRFEIGRMLGAGGMGTVHAALDVAIGRPVAVKLLRAELARDQHQLQRFEREARAAAKLAHPNVVGVTELVRDDVLGLGLVMELLAGRSLATRLEDGPLSETEAVNVFMQALDGLTAAHAAGMVHRDLKPSNVFLVPLADGVLVKLLDFGIVKLAEEGAVPKLTRKGALIGTPAYMSPEQVACAPVDLRSDVYSMGACLYEALIAQPPYDEPHSLALVAAVGAGPPRDLHEIDRDVSPDLVHVVRVAMARDPSARYQTAAAMREALRNAVVRKGPRPPGPKRPKMREPLSQAKTQPALPRTTRPRPYVPLAIAASVVAVLVALALALGHAPHAAGTVVPPASAPSSPPILSPPPPPSLSPALPRGVEPPPTRSPSPVTTRVPPAHPPPTHTRRRGHVGDDILDPFAQ